MSKHTPGPWVKVRDPRVNPPWNYVVNSSMHNESHQQICVEVTEANARLIAAAPDMFKALHLARASLKASWEAIDGKSDGLGLSVIDHIDKIIAKVEGEN